MAFLGLREWSIPARSIYRAASALRWLVMLNDVP